MGFCCFLFQATNTSRNVAPCQALFEGWLHHGDEQDWSLTRASQSLFWWLGEAGIMQRTNKSNPTINYSSAKHTRFCVWCGRASTGEWKCLAKKWRHRRQPRWKEEVHGEGNVFQRTWRPEFIFIRSWKQPLCGDGMAHGTHRAELLLLNHGSE